MALYLTNNNLFVRKNRLIRELKESSFKPLYSKGSLSTIFVYGQVYSSSMCAETSGCGIFALHGI